MENKIILSRQLKDSRYMIAEDFAIGVDEKGNPIYRFAILTIKDIVKENVVDMEKVKDKNRKYDDDLLSQKYCFYFTENGIDCKPYVLSAEKCRLGLEKSAETKVVNKWIGKKTLLFIEKNVKAFGKITDAIRFKPVPIQICEVCKKELDEKLFRQSVEKYGIPICSAECKEKIKYKLDKQQATSTQITNEILNETGEQHE